MNYAYIFSENEESDADTSAEDDEIFFGPVGHTEKCVAVAVNEVAEASRPLSPLSATQMAELCREAYTVAYQIAHADSSQLPSSRTETSSSDGTSGSNPVEDSSSIVTETDGGPSLDKTFSCSSADIVSPGNTTFRQESCRQDSEMLSEGLLSGHGSTSQDLMSNVAEIKIQLCADETLPSSTADDLTLGNTEILSNLTPDNTEISSDITPGTDSSEIASAITPGSSEISSAVTPVNTEISSDIIRRSTEISSGQDSDRTLSSNVFEGMLSSLGSVLPVIEPGSLKHDEYGVVKFAAAADDTSAADAKTNCRTGIPTSSGVRRAFSAKTSGTRASGIPMRGLTVRQIRQVVIKYGFTLHFTYTLHIKKYINLVVYVTLVLMLLV